MKLTWLALVVACGCSKKDEQPATPADPPSAVADKAVADKPSDKPVSPPPDAPPNVTPETLFAPEPVWSVEAVPRGLWMRVGDGPVIHKCRQEFAMAWVQNSQLRTAASKADPGATTCAPSGAFTVCTYKKPGGDPTTEPKDLARWIFVGPDTAPILVGITYGAQDDWVEVAPEFAKVEGCPRPSDDPR